MYEKKIHNVRKIKKKAAKVLLPVQCTTGVQAMALLSQYYRQSYPASPGKKNKQPSHKSNHLLSFHEQQMYTIQKATW